MNKINCDFCDEQVEKIQEIARGKKIKIIYPHAPLIEANLLFAPIRHVERFEDLEPEEMTDLLVMVKAASQALKDLYGVIGFNFFSNNGTKAGQHAPHVHFHLLGRTENETISPLKILNNPKEFNITRLSDETIISRASKISEAIKKYLL
jgi:diadenosine tetraphosphate (Ap4A) HIT family hydrolase